MPYQDHMWGVQASLWTCRDGEAKHGISTIEDGVTMQLQLRSLQLLRAGNLVSCVAEAASILFMHTYLLKKCPWKDEIRSPLEQRTLITASQAVGRSRLRATSALSLTPSRWEVKAVGAQQGGGQQEQIRQTIEGNWDASTVVHMQPTESKSSS
jgi:hypothetical protein